MSAPRAVNPPVDCPGPGADEAPIRLPSADGLARYVEPPRPLVSWRTARLLGALAAALVFYVVCWRLARIDPVRLWQGLPRLARWLGRAWPPDVHELGVLSRRTAETVAMAAMGTTIAALLAVPACLFASRNITPLPALYYPVRWFLNALRGIDSFVFALVLVAAVGLGPFAGVLGVGLHTWGSMTKLYADAIENANLAPLEAVIATGAGRPRAVLYALLPDLLPTLLSITLFWWEFNVRASTVLGIVGAGGIGQELKNSVDLLDFARLATILLLILTVVTTIDQGSSYLRRRLL